MLSCPLLVAVCGVLVDSQEVVLTISKFLLVVALTALTWLLVTTLSMSLIGSLPVPVLEALF
jgi:hypothetical protein